jgi:hypothetical protein
VDVLASGSERPPVWDRVRVPGWATALLAVLVLAVAAAGVAAVPPVRAAGGAAGLEVEARSVVAVRARGRDGLLLLRLRHPGRGPLEVAVAALDVPGVRAAAAGPVVVEGGGRAELAVPVSVRSCEQLAAGSVLLAVRRPGEPAREVARRVPSGALRAGCGPPADARSVAVAVRAVEGRRRVEGEGVRGVVAVEVTNLGADLELARVDAEVPGVITSSGSLRVPAGERGTVRLGFHVPVCADLRRTGRVVVTLRSPAVGTRELGFRATEDEEARTVRDLDLDVLLRACRGAVPVP